jgi:hypothetical protein
MRDRPEHDNGRDRSLPHAKSRGLRFTRKGAPGRRNRVLRTGEFQRKKNPPIFFAIRCPAPFLLLFRFNPTPATLFLQVLLRLRTARRTFEPPIYPRLSSGGTRQPSIYERDLEHPRLTPDPLPQPCPHVWDGTTPMRPVSQAIQEGVGLLLGSAANAVTGRGSVFGRFW